MTFQQRLDSENADGSVLQFAKQYRIRGKCCVAQIINNMYVFPLTDKRQRHILARGLSLHENVIYDRQCLYVFDANDQIAFGGRGDCFSTFNPKPKVCKPLPHKTSEGPKVIIS